MCISSCFLFLYIYNCAQVAAFGPVTTSLGAGPRLKCWARKVTLLFFLQVILLLLCREILAQACQEGKHLLDLSSWKQEKPKKSAHPKHSIESTGIAWAADKLSNKINEGIY